MNITNLSAGMKVKNYREMCSLIDERTTTGLAKQQQIARWKNYVKWSRIGHTFVIEETYTHKQDKVFIEVDSDQYSQAIKLLKMNKIPCR